MANVTSGLISFKYVAMCNCLVASVYGYVLVM